MTDTTTAVRTIFVIAKQGPKALTPLRRSLAQEPAHTIGEALDRALEINLYSYGAASHIIAKRAGRRLQVWTLVEATVEASRQKVEADLELLESVALRTDLPSTGEEAQAALDRLEEYDAQVHRATRAARRLHQAARIARLDRVRDAYQVRRVMLLDFLELRGRAARAQAVRTDLEDGDAWGAE